MRNNFYIRRSYIKDDEWHLLDPLPKHPLCSVMPTHCRYITITSNGKLIDRVTVPVYSDRIYNLPEFIEKFNEYSLFLLL